MIWPYKIGIIAVCFFAAASSGFFYGRNFEREAALKSAVKAYQLASKIQNEVDLYSDYALCLALNGVSKPFPKNDPCEALLRRVDGTAENK
ncbi:hypothetical protein N5853_01980 [Bartonella sp. HY329]|uniref:hypothetical protein n=1 Tax=unclassified Bartonella TaxID=2645622 RepID=UPI0021C9E01A|nr:MULTISPECIES: hypothetical protein [unclassified Bartonella]UXM95437.1 hypothetical protein N5853_01980 [Bartonella sp. HY329]UXN09762.1 hypothetical protein N5852_01985 [Bartonella sp. HY328]